MGEAKRGELLQFLRKTRERAAPFKATQCSQLSTRGSARPHEIRVVGVGQAVRAGLGGADHSALGQSEYRTRGSGKGEKLRNRLRALRVGNRMTAAILDGQSDPFGSRHIRQKFGSRAVLGPHLEVTH